MPTFRIETNQGVFDIEADREPTQEEALQAIGGTPESPVRAPISTTPQQGRFAGDSMWKDVGEAIPFSNAPSEFREGQRSGTQIFGDNLAGDLAGLLLGGGRSAATVLNPLGKVIGIVPKAAQAAGSAAGGDLNAALQDLTGSRPVQSAAEIPDLYTGNTNLDTLIGGLTGTYNEAVAKQPLALLGLTPKALAQQGAAIRNLPSNIAQVGRGVSEAAGRVAESVKSAARGETPIDLAKLEEAQAKLRNLEYLAEQNRINKTKTAEARNADNLILEEELAKARTEAEALGAEAIRANQELGPQIDILNEASAQAPELAGRITARLPARQEPGAFARSVSEEISKAEAEAKPGLQEDYSKVAQAADPNLKIESSGAEQVAREISSEKKSGYSAALRRVLKSVLGESMERKPVDPLKQLSAATRDIYENLPESQKQSFLDQAGFKLGETVPKTYSWAELEQRYQDLNGFIEEAKKNSPTDVRHFIRLKNAIAEDMAAYAEAAGTDVKVLFDEANANFAANRAKFGNKNIAPLVTEIAEASPATIVSKIVGENKASTIESLKQILSPEKFQEVQSQYANELFSPGKGGAPGKVAPFEANHFLKKFQSLGDETLSSVFGEEGLRELYKIKELAESGDKATALKSTLDEYNSKASKAEKAYQEAKKPAEEKRIMNELKAAAEEALDKIKDERMKADFEKARQDIRKASTPQKVSLATRFLLGLGSAITATTMGASAGSAITAGLAAAAFARSIRRAGPAVVDYFAKRQMEKDNK